MSDDSQSIGRPINNRPILQDSSDSENNDFSSERRARPSGVKTARCDSIIEIGRAQNDRRSGRGDLKKTLSRWSSKTQKSPKTFMPNILDPMKKVATGAGNFIINHLGSVSVIF